jgi:excisionase family DNA binding protein
MTTTFSSSQKLLSVRDVAKHFSVNGQTVRKWVRAGELKTLRFGGSIRIRTEDLQDFITANERQRATVGA